MLAVVVAVAVAVAAAAVVVVVAVAVAAVTAAVVVVAVAAPMAGPPAVSDTFSWGMAVLGIRGDTHLWQDA